VSRRDGGAAVAASTAYLMYLLRNLRWKSLRTVSLMKRRSSFFGSRDWFLKTTSSSHLVRAKWYVVSGE
jgi:hypothetical protein